MKSIRFVFFIACLSTASSVAAETSDSTIVRLLRNEGITFSHDNNVKLLTTGQEKFDDMFSAIRQARSSVHLEYFNFRNDSIAMELFHILAEKAREGVEIRALYDDFGNMSNNRPLKRHHLDSLRALGINIHAFMPIKFPWIHCYFHRDHRKIVVIDGKIAYTGGMNVADYYIKGTEVVGEWHDMHCRIEGEEVNTLQRIFRRMWKKVTGEDFSGPQYYRGYTTPSYFTGKLPQGHKMVGIINREPYRSPAIMRRFYCGAIDAARDSIKLINPYFCLIPCISRALKRAISRGVKVELMIAANSDIPITPDAAFLNMYRLMKRGARVFIYQGGFHHTKVIMVDGRFCTVGSTNLDARSLRHDYEENAVIIDPATTHELEQLFERDKRRSFVLTKESWNRWRSAKDKLIGYFGKLISFLM